MISHQIILESSPVKHVPMLSVVQPTVRYNSQKEYDSYLQSHGVHPDFSPTLRVGDIISLALVNQLIGMSEDSLFNHTKVLVAVETDYEKIRYNMERALTVVSLVQYPLFAKALSINLAPIPYNDIPRGYVKVRNHITDRMKLDYLPDYLEASKQRAALTKHV